MLEVMLALGAACIVVLLAALLLYASRAQGALYIGTGSINRVNLDGSLFETEFIPRRSGSVCALAVDSSHIYWADRINDTIGRANLDGTAVDEELIKFADWTIPCGLALDSKYVYWASWGTDTIGRARLDGSEVDESFISTAPGPCAIAIDQAALYWASEIENEIWRTDIKGVNAPEIVIDEGAVEPCGLALTDSHLFWVQRGAGTIGRSNLDGSERRSDFITGAHSPVSVVVQGGHLYWVNIKRDLESVGRAGLDGANINQGFIGGLRFPYGLAADSVEVVPRPPAPPQLSSALRLRKLRRHRDGSITFPVDLLGNGWFDADAPGLKVEVRPEEVEGSGMLSAGRKWLEITPTTKRGDGSRCVLRAFRRGLRVQVVLRLRFSEPDKTIFAKDQRFFMFKPRQKGKARSMSCLA